MRKFVKLILVNLALLMVGAVVAELVFGTWFSSDPLDRVNISRGINVMIDARGIYPGGRVFTYRRNRWGFRGAEIDPAEIDILTVGGSTTNQLYLPEEQTWQAAMMRRFSELGHRATVANAGIEGLTTYGMLHSAESWFPFVPSLKPKYVLAYIGINDALADADRSRDRLVWRTTWRWIEYNSALLRLVRTIRGAVQARTERVTHGRIDFAHAEWTDRPRYPDNAEARPNSSATAYERRLTELVHRIRALGAEPILITQRRGDIKTVDGTLFGLAVSDGMTGLDHQRLLSVFNATTLSVCAAERLFCIDAANDIAYSLDDFYDLVHTSPQGSEKLGRFLAEKIAGKMRE